MLTPTGKKRCPDCGKEKLATTDYFYRNGRWLQQRCKPCDNSHRGRSQGREVYVIIGRALGISAKEARKAEESAFRKLRRSGVLREFAR